MDLNKRYNTEEASTGKCSGTPAKNQANRPPVEFMRLPEFVWLRVMNFLPFCDRYHMTLSCDLFRQLFFHSSLWRAVELVCYLGTDGEGGSKLMLRPSHQKIAVQFGHLFHFVSLHMPSAEHAVEEATARILSALSERASLRGLTLVKESSGQIASRTTSTPNGASLVRELVEKAQGLHYLDLSRWPIFESNLQDDQLSVFNVLVLPDTCRQLRSLNIAIRSMYCSDGTEQFRHAVVRLVSKFVHLSHLQVRQVLLSDLLFYELAATHRDQLHSLTVLNFEPGDREDGVEEDTTPHIPDTSWAMLRSACPDLELHVQAEVAHVPCIRWAMKPHVPVVSVQLLFCSLPTNLLSGLCHVHASLRALTCHVLPVQSHDLPLIQVVTACSRLQHLVFYGKVHSNTIVHLASLQRQWRTFRFRQKHILLLNSEGEKTGHTVSSSSGGTVDRRGDRQTKLNNLCTVVSTHLGYPWTPCEL